MIETVCAELLITGLLRLNTDVVNIDKNNIYHIYKDTSAYIIPESKSLASVECSSQKLNENMSDQMGLFVKKIN